MVSDIQNLLFIIQDVHLAVYWQKCLHGFCVCGLTHVAVVGVLYTRPCVCGCSCRCPVY